MPMPTVRILLAALLASAATGCTSDTTKNMAQTCTRLLEHGGGEDARTFIADAQAHLAALAKPGNRLTDYVRDVRDPDAEKYRPELTQCLWLLKSRQA